MKVNLSMPLDGHKPGDVMDRDDGLYLIQCGWATEAPAKKAKPKRPMVGLVEPGQD